MTTPDPRHGGLLILDYGSQYTPLIARRVREQNVYAAVLPPGAPPSEALAHAPRGVILSGGPNSVFAPGAPQLPAWLHDAGLPVLGICYGMQAIVHALGGNVGPAHAREYGLATLAHSGGALFNGLPAQLDVWMSHGDRIDAPPSGFSAVAATPHAPYAAIGDDARGWYGVQFHPEVRHTPHGVALLRNFALAVCGCATDWTPNHVVDSAVARVQQQVGPRGRVVLGLSGGVDSAVAAAMIQRAIGDRLTAVFVNTGLLREGEPEQVVAAFGQAHDGARLVAVDASETFLDALRGITDPEAKRHIIGDRFYDVFWGHLRAQGDDARFLGQGTIYPDVIESGRASAHAQVIKSHHNTRPLPADMAHLTLVEPLRDMFKDEVRAAGLALGLPEALVWRQPFPGPGLAIRCLGEVTFERLAVLRATDAIFTELLAEAGLLRHTIDDAPADGAPGALRGTSQAFAVLLPVKAVGVMGDNRTYEEVVALRAVTTDDFMTADWARLPYALLAEASRRIVNQVRGVNRVVYDITSKPPGTIEWE